MIKSNYRKKIKKDYQCKNLRNPFFHKAKKGTKKKPWLLFLMIYIVLFSVLLWFFAFSNFWRLSNIEVSGLTRRSDEDLKILITNQSSSKHFIFFNENNILFFNTDQARTEILKNFNFANVEVTTKWPRTVKVDVLERPYSFIFREGSVIYYASADAYLIKEIAVNPEDLKKYFILDNNSPTSLLNDDKIDIPSDYLGFIINLARSLEAYPELIAENYQIDQGYRSVNVKFLNGPTVYFNTKLVAAEQLERLVLVKKEKIKDNFSKINYIDLRYGDRLFIN
jgi:cell division septal protein FtsQ